MHEDELNYKKFMDGDIEGFENLVLSYKNKLIFFIAKYVKDLHLAEDLAQDAFVEIYVHKERFRIGNNFKTYLFTIGRNKAIDYIRKYGNEISSDFISEDGFIFDMHSSFHTMSTIGGSELANDFLKKEESKLVHSTIDKLKEEYRVVIHLIDFEQLSYKEAAIIMKKTVPQIKILIHRARKALGKVLLKEGYTYEE